MAVSINRFLNNQDYWVEFDQDGSGTIEFGEYLYFASGILFDESLGSDQLTEDEVLEIKELFDIADQDHDGSISVQELRRFSTSDNFPNVFLNIREDFEPSSSGDLCLCRIDNFESSNNTTYTTPSEWIYVWNMLVSDSACSSSCAQLCARAMEESAEMRETAVSTITSTGGGSQCTANTYTITYNNMTGATNFTNAPDTYTVESATITLGTPTRTGYTFDGWYDAETGGNQVTQITTGSTGNKTLWARWTQCNTANGYEVVNNTCSCVSPKVEDNGVCHTACGTGETWSNGACVCDASSNYYGTAGSCQVCNVSNGYTLANNTCSCVSPKEETNGVCHDACGTGYTYNPSAGSGTNPLANVDLDGATVLNSSSQNLTWELSLVDGGTITGSATCADETGMLENMNEMDEDLANMYMLQFWFPDNYYMIDKDGDGYLDALEIQTLFRILGENISMSDAQEFINEVDQDGNGKVDRSEEQNLLIRIFPEAADYEPEELYMALYEKFYYSNTNFEKSTSGSHCWCRMDGGVYENGTTYTAQSKWVYPWDIAVGSYGNRNCRTDCAEVCAYAMEESEVMRQTMVSTITSGAGSQCTANTYTITYNNMTGATNFTNAPDTYTVESATISLGTPTKSGYTFGGWYDNEQLTGTAITEIPAGSTGDKNLYAAWSADEYNITYMDGGAVLTGITPATYIAGTGATINATPAKAHGSFTAWCTDAGLAPNSCAATQTIATTDTGDKTFYAKFTCDTGYTLTTGSTVDLTTIIGNEGGESRAYININNSLFTERGASYGQSFYGLTTDDANAFAINYGDRGIVHGHGACSTTPGTANFDGANSTFTTASSITDQPNQAGAEYCWCHIDGYTPNGGNKQSISSSWLYFDNANADVTTCTSVCAGLCTDGIDGSMSTTGGVMAFRDALFASVDDALSETASTCTPNTYTILYDLNGGTPGSNHPDTYTIISNNITISNPTKAGYSFTGWTVTTAPTAWGTGSSASGDTDFVIATGTYGNIALTATWSMACPADHFVPVDYPEMCFPHKLHIGDNLLYMKSEKLTTPSLNVAYGGDVFYANMTTVPTYISSGYEHYFKTIYNDTVYYICDDTTYDPNANSSSTPDTPGIPNNKQDCDNAGGQWINEECVFN